MRALVLGLTTLALSSGAALAQAPAQDVYPGYGYAPYGYSYVPYAYGYAAPAPLYDYSGPAYGYSGPAFGYSGPAYGYSAPGYGYSGPAYGYSAPGFGYSGPALGYSGPAYGPAPGQPPVAGETAENPPAGSIPTQTARHHRSVRVSASGSNSSHKGDFLKAAPANGGY
jgi:hypothetical protein